MNKLITGDNVAVLKRFPDDSVDFIFTSPPYDKRRTYEGFPPVDFVVLGRELRRVIKPNRPVAFVIQDGVEKKRRTGTSFRFIVDMMDRVGFYLWDCLIAHKTSALPQPLHNPRLRMEHELVPIFVKGNNQHIHTFHAPLIPVKNPGEHHIGRTRTVKGGYINKTSTNNKMKIAGTIWRYSQTSVYPNRLKYQHPAVFPNHFAKEFIETFTNPGDLVLDPFCGSGTTCVEAYKLNRFYAGIDISYDYIKIARTLLDELPRRRYFNIGD